MNVHFFINLSKSITFTIVAMVTYPRVWCSRPPGIWGSNCQEEEQGCRISGSDMWHSYKLGNPGPWSLHCLYMKQQHGLKAN